MSKDVDKFLQELAGVKFNPTPNVDDIVNNVQLRKKSIMKRRWFISIASLFVTVGLTGGIAMASGPLDNIIGEFTHIFSKHQTGILLSISYGNQPLWGGNIKHSATYNDYDGVVSDVGVPVPELQYPGLIVHGIRVDWYAGDHMVIDADGLLRVTPNAYPSEISLTIYKNLDQTIYLNGQSLTGPDSKIISIDGHEAKMLTFEYRGANSNVQNAYYLSWVQGPWTCVLGAVGDDISQSDVTKIAHAIMNAGKRN
ncbi:hypothetical protein [Alicyclobacillus shizuokensis]|uniref:hypothetical protein n=1 Tax=Alicyclobacillus shizuokensis TaxID=392014 RepID=UPI00082CB737|nr:hypothetical protein [Alicyclobacillus shizuokensis]